jgi:hypothetical protein
VVRRLLRDIVAFGPVGVVPVASEYLAKDRVQWFLDSAVSQISGCLWGNIWGVWCLRRLDVPTAEVKFGHGYESLDRVLDLGDG